MLRPAIVCTTVFMAACGDSDSPEAQIRRTIDAMETAAEERDVGDLMEFVADDFRDAHGQGNNELRRYIQGYFIANQSIHLLTRVNRIEFPQPDEARLEVTVGMAGREAAAAKAWNLAADIHDFNVTLRRHGDDWRVLYAESRRPGGG